MREHLSRVIEALLEATEVPELERARAQVAEQRRRYTPSIPFNGYSRRAAAPLLCNLGSRTLPAPALRGFQQGFR